MGLQALCGIVRFWLFYYISPFLFPRFSPAAWYLLGMCPPIFSTFSATFATFIAEYSAPDYKLTSLVDANKVLSATPIPEPLPNRCCDECCNGKFSRIVCWIFVAIIILSIIITYSLGESVNSYYDSYYGRRYYDGYRGYYSYGG